MVIVINCVGGIGDIIFSEPIFRHLWQKHGEKPSVIIHDHMMWMQEYIDSAVFFPASNFPEEASATHHIPDKFVNLKHAHQIHRGYPPHYHDDIENCMPDKYRLLGLDPELWKTCKLHFNHDKGMQLASVLGVSIFDEYILRNEHSQAGDINIMLDSGKTVVDMQVVRGFTLCDWALLHKQADEIHTVSTSTFYLMQALCNEGWAPPSVYMYPRPNWDGLRGISQLTPDFKYNQPREVI